jgi:hypothetical protein
MNYKFAPVDSYITPVKFYPTPKNTNVDSLVRMSYFGTPVLSNMEIPRGNYKTLDGKTISFDGIRIDAVLFDVSQSKNIISTPIQGRNGTVKEYISDGDFQITASGIITGESFETARNFTVTDGQMKYPESDVRKLIEIFKIPTSFEIISDFLDFFEIRNVVIDSFTVGQISGQRAGQPFEIRMISDTPIELIEI